VLSVQAQVEICLAPPGYCPRYIRTIDMSVEGSSANQRYLGHYMELFDDKGEKPISTWSALAWILEDYGLLESRKWQLICYIDNKVDPPGVYSLLYFACTCVWDLFIGGLFTLQKIL
jgi:hypothetical protein